MSSNQFFDLRFTAQRIDGGYGFTLKDTGDCVYVIGAGEQKICEEITGKLLAGGKARMLIAVPEKAQTPWLDYLMKTIQLPGYGERVSLHSTLSDLVGTLLKSHKDNNVVVEVCHLTPTHEDRQAYFLLRTDDMLIPFPDYSRGGNQQQSYVREVLHRILNGGRPVIVTYPRVRDNMLIAEALSRFTGVPRFPAQSEDDVARTFWSFEEALQELCTYSELPDWLAAETNLPDQTGVR